MVQQNTEKQLEDLKELQAKLKQMSSDARDKDLLYKQLVCTEHLVIKMLIGCNAEIHSLKLCWYVSHI